MVNIEVLKELREQNHYSYRFIAKKIKVNKRKVQAFEKGEETPTEEELLKLADLYQVQVSDLLYKEEVEESKGLFKVILAIIVSILMGLLLKNIVFIILAPVFSLLFIANKMELNKYEKEEGEKPKSLFGYALKEKYKKLLFLESNMIACGYILFTFLFRLLHFDFLVLEIDFFESEIMNQLFIISGTYFLLVILCFLIELLFAKLMKNHTEDTWL